MFPADATLANPNKANAATMRRMLPPYLDVYGCEQNAVAADQQVHGDMIQERPYHRQTIQWHEIADGAENEREQANKGNAPTRYSHRSSIVQHIAKVGAHRHLRALVGLSPPP